MRAFPLGSEGVRTTYTSDQVDIPVSFLKSLPHDNEPITLSHVDFASSDLKTYADCFAIVLEHVLSPSECAVLLKLAEASAHTQGWKPAMLNYGGNIEAMNTEVRNNDRIIWDSREIVGRLWERCCTVPGFRDLLGEVVPDTTQPKHPLIDSTATWAFTRPNERMRFLRYGPGQYFKRHCDGAYEEVDAETGKHEKSFYTLHLYLNQDEELEGGATSFHLPARYGGSAKTPDEKTLDVESRLGRVLIFQHKRLLHSGAEVTKGIKYTMRTDLMYERID